MTWLALELALVVQISVIVPLPISHSGPSPRGDRRMGASAELEWKAAEPESTSWRIVG